MGRYGRDPSVVEAWKSKLSTIAKVNACQLATDALWRETSERAYNAPEGIYKQWLTNLSRLMMDTRHGLVFMQEVMAQGRWSVEDMLRNPRYYITRPPTAVLRGPHEAEARALVLRCNKLMQCICTVTHQPLLRPPAMDPLTRSGHRRR